MKLDRRRVTMKDVAEAAGVSTATVSIVNSRQSKIPVNEKTRRIVLETVERLNYKMNEQARSLRTGKSHTIGIVASDITQPYSGKMIKYVEQQVHRRGYHFLLSDIQNNREQEKFYLELFRQKRVDGILFVGASNELDDEELLGLVESEIPVVLTEREAKGCNIPCILVDNLKGGLLMTTHLIDRGHKNIAFITGPENNIISLQRREGYQLALRKNGLPILEELVAHGGFGLEDGYRAMKHLLENKNIPDAVFAFNDMTAIGAMKSIREFGLRIPDDISIAGFDDISMAEYTEPPLTTVHQPTVEMCVQGVDLLLDILDGKCSINSRVKIVLEPELIIRKSCGFA